MQILTFQTHLPGYIAQHDALKGKGIQEIVCVAVNDPFVMAAWGEKQGVGNKVGRPIYMLVL